jgi:hypothetical protein
MTQSPASVIRKTIARDIRIAWIVALNLRERGARPAQHQSCMPEPVREFFEAYGLEKARIGSMPPSGRDIDTHDAVMAAMASHKLCVMDRRLLWARAARRPWKDIVREIYVPMRTGKRFYAQALMTFGVAYGLVQIERRREAA